MLLFLSVKYKTIFMDDICLQQPQLSCSKNLSSTVASLKNEVHSDTLHAVVSPWYQMSRVLSPLHAPSTGEFYQGPVKDNN